MLSHFHRPELHIAYCCVLSAPLRFHEPVTVAMVAFIPMGQDMFQSHVRRVFYMCQTSRHFISIFDQQADVT